MRTETNEIGTKCGDLAEVEADSLDSLTGWVLVVQVARPAVPADAGRSQFGGQPGQREGIMSQDKKGWGVAQC